MSHEVETMAWAHEVPWHGLGEDASTLINDPDEFYRKAGLNWSVDLHPLFANVNGNLIPVKNRFALVRDTDNQVMTVASARWNPLQNKQMIEFFKNYVTAGAATLETAGSLRGGKVVWGLAKLGRGYETRPGDRTEGYLLFTSPHTVGSAITVRVTTVRVVCANTMAIALNGKVDYSQSHLQPFNFDLAREAVAAAHETLAECERRSKVLDGLKINLEDAIKKVVIPVFAPEVAKDPELMAHVMEPEAMPTKAMEILYSIVEAPGAIKGTGWGVLNGITHWCDHVAGNKSADSRLTRSWTGDLAAKKLQAEEVLLQLAA